MRLPRSSKLVGKSVAFLRTIKVSIAYSLEARITIIANVVAACKNPARSHHLLGIIILFPMFLSIIHALE